jgi:hypothetical protein
VVHKAGQPFTLNATAIDATNVVTTNYAGSPTVQTLACFLVPACANGGLAPGLWQAPAPTNGTVTTNTATYSEAAAFNLTLQDQTFAAVDVADTPSSYSNGVPAPTGRWITQTPATVQIGRFVPNNFVVAPAALPTPAPVLRTANTTDAACNALAAAPKRVFTYIGKPFGYVTLPTSAITAQNAAGGTTTNYRGVGLLWKIAGAAAVTTCASASTCTQTTGSITQAYTSGGGQFFDGAQLGTILTPGLLGAPVVTPANGTGTTTPNVTDVLAFQRVVSNPVVPFGANISLNVTVNDNSENGTPGNGIITTSGAGATFNGTGLGVAFDSVSLFGGATPGSEMRYGQIRVNNANGSELLPLLTTAKAQYFFSPTVGFVDNVGDNCTVLPASSIGQGNFTQNVNLGGALTATILNANGTVDLPVPATFLAGTIGIRLSAPGATHYGALDMVLDLGTTATPNNCSPIVGAAATGASMTFLRNLQSCSAGNFDQDPRARMTFGVYDINTKSIFQRENY